MRKTSEAQRNADKRWREKNRDHANYLKNRTSARCFVRNRATLEDIEEFKSPNGRENGIIKKENNKLC